MTDGPETPREVRLEWLHKEIGRTKAYVQIERIDSLAELRWSTPGPYGRDYRTALQITINQAEQTLEALEAERELILEQSLPRRPRLTSHQARFAWLRGAIADTDAYLRSVWVEQAVMTTGDAERCLPNYFDAAEARHTRAHLMSEALKVPWSTSLVDVSDPETDDPPREPTPYRLVALHNARLAWLYEAIGTTEAFLRLERSSPAPMVGGNVHTLPSPLLACAEQTLEALQCEVGVVWLRFQLRSRYRPFGWNG